RTEGTQHTDKHTPGCRHAVESLKRAGYQVPPKFRSFDLYCFRADRSDRHSSQMPPEPLPRDGDVDPLDKTKTGPSLRAFHEDVVQQADAPRALRPPEQETHQRKAYGRTYSFVARFSLAAMWNRQIDSSHSKARRNARSDS